MGDAAPAGENGIDPEVMLQRLEALQRERDELDARFAALEQEDDQLVERAAQRALEREGLERRRLEMDSETTASEARREALEDEQRALVQTRDTLDHDYTELYARLDKVADDIAAPGFVPPAVTDRVVDVDPPAEPARDPGFPDGGKGWVVVTPVPSESPLPMPAPSRTTLVIVPEPATRPDAAEPVTSRTGSRRVFAIAASIVTIIIVGVLAAWPADPPAPTTTLDPKAELDKVRAAFLPSSVATPAAPPAVATDAPAIVERVAPPSSTRKSEKRRARAKRARAEAKAKKRGAPP